jgi:ribonuclease HI
MGFIYRRILCIVRLKLFFDGACEPVNPGGVGAYGFAVYEDDREIHGEGGIVCVGGRQCTNNVAEYTALIKAMEWALSAGAAEVKVYGDSQLVVRQMLGVYQVKAPHLVPLYEKAMELSRQFRKFSISWVPREQNARADYYSKKAYCDFLKTHPEVRQLYARRLATERQVALLKKLGVEDAECLPRREASRLIERLLSRRD